MSLSITDLESWDFLINIYYDSKIVERELIEFLPNSTQEDCEITPTIGEKNWSSCANK